MRALVDLIERYRPGYADTIRSANEIEIEDYEAVAGPLPRAYVRFLTTMGKSIGDLDVHDASFCVTNFTISCSINYRRHPRDRFLLVAAGRGLGCNYFLDREAPSGANGDDCMVVMSGSHPTAPVPVIDQLHVGLEEFLYVEAYRTVRLPLFAHVVEIAPTISPLGGRSSTDDDVLRVCAVAERLGFDRVPPAKWCALYERGDAAMVLAHHPTAAGAFSFRLGTDDEDELARLSSAFRSVAAFDAPRPW